MITIESLRDMFVNIQQNTKWDIQGNLLWGYFFTDPDPDKLKPLAETLASSGHRVVDIYETDDKSTWFLHVEREETHSPESLFQKNADFYRLADEYCVESYDGMDVGPILPK